MFPTDTIVENKTQLVDYLEAGCTSRGSFKIGAEQERFVYLTNEFIVKDETAREHHFCV